MDSDFRADSSFSQNNGIELLSRGDGKSEILLHVGEQSYNPYGTVNGGLIYTLCDAAACYAAYNGVCYVTQNGNITYYKPVNEGDLRAYGSVSHAGSHLTVAHVDVRNTAGDTVAEAQFTLFPVHSIKLDGLLDQAEQQA